jgi:sulfate transport system ATP-binding protein
VAILNAGKLEQVRSPDDIYDNPSSPFVISFVGDAGSIPINCGGGRLLYEGEAFQAKFEGSS